MRKIIKNEWRWILACLMLSLLISLGAFEVKSLFRQDNNYQKVLATDFASFGNEYIFNPSAWADQYKSSGYLSTTRIDSTHFVIIYQDRFNSYKGTAIIGTISSGDNIAWGSE